MSVRRCQVAGGGREIKLRQKSSKSPKKKRSGKRKQKQPRTIYYLLRSQFIIHDSEAAKRKTRKASSWDINFITVPLPFPLPPLPTTFLYLHVSLCHPLCILLSALNILWLKTRIYAASGKRRRLPIQPDEELNLMRRAANRPSFNFPNHQRVTDMKLFIHQLGPLSPDAGAYIFHLLIKNSMGENNRLRLFHYAVRSLLGPTSTTRLPRIIHGNSSTSMSEQKKAARKSFLAN